MHFGLIKIELAFKKKNSYHSILKLLHTYPAIYIDTPDPSCHPLCKVVNNELVIRNI